MKQLARITLTAAAGSPDEQLATPDETGSYGELVDEIDELLTPSEPQERSNPNPSR